MRKAFCSFLVVLFTLSMVNPEKAHAEVPAKARAFLTIVGYGAAGGAILGAASMAFGTSSRAVAQGASLGLYAGILFGTYVLVSHHNKQYGNYDDNSSPYRQSNDIYSDDYREDGGGSSDENSEGGFFDRYQKLEGKFQKKGGDLPPFQLNLLQYHF